MKKSIGFIFNILSYVIPKHVNAWVHHLFATPRKGKLSNDNLPQFIQKAKPGSFKYNGKDVITYTWNLTTNNELPILLLIHGWESNSARWEELVNYLGNNFQFVAFDAPSLGQSSGGNLSVKDYQNVIGLALNHFKPQMVVAHSLGAFSLHQQLARSTYPFVQKVVLMGCLDRFEGVVQLYFKMLGYAPKVQRNYVNYLSTLFQMPLGDYTSSKAALDVEQEILCIHDRDDDMIQYETTMSFHEVLKQRKNKVIVTGNIGHRLQHEVVFQSIQSFLQSQ